MESQAGAAGGMVPLAGSERSPLPGARDVGPADPNQRLAVTVVVRRRQGAPRPGAAGSRLSRAEFAQQYGADAADLERVAAFARQQGLEVAESSAARRSVALAGTVAALQAAFGVQLRRYTAAGGEHRGRRGPLHVPADLAGVVEGVFGLDDRPQARPHFRPLAVTGRPVRPQAAGVAFTPVQLAALYAFPAGLRGDGQTIAVIELGGGYTPGDLQTYFSGLRLAAPAVTAISVDGGQNAPAGDPNSADGEVMLDLEVAGAVAPGAALAVYFAPNTDRGFLDAITTAVHDQTNRPPVVSISWGSAESAWTAQALQQFDQAFADAATLGLTVCCAAGDNGSSDGVTDGLAHVDFPASSPHVLGCGGTRLNATGATIQGEVVWNEPGHGATGGGVSDVFDLPDWQGSAVVLPSANAGGRVGRGVPDVAGDADPLSGYQVRVDGQDVVFGGTSAVAPLWAGLIALLNSRLGRAAGFLNPVLYGPGGVGSCRDITSGDNGAYAAGPGWDACTGWGSPDGGKLLQVLGGGAASGSGGGAAGGAQP